MGCGGRNNTFGRWLSLGDWMCVDTRPWGSRGRLHGHRKGPWRWLGGRMRSRGQRWYGRTGLASNLRRDLALYKSIRFLVPLVSLRHDRVVYRRRCKSNIQCPSPLLLRRRIRMCGRRLWPRRKHRGCRFGAARRAAERRGLRLQHMSIGGYNMISEKRWPRLRLH